MPTPSRYASGSAAPAKHRPNVLFLIFGLLLIIAGLTVMVFGLLAAFQAVPKGAPQLSDLGVKPDARSDLEPLINGFMVFVIGCTVFTVGRYLWRGARRRGWRDRFGRFLIITGYIVVTVGLYVLHRFILAALAADDMGQSERIILRGLIVFLAIGIVSALILVPGLRLAREKKLMTVEVNAQL